MNAMTFKTVNFFALRKRGYFVLASCDSEAEVLDRIENGYVDEATGKEVRFSPTTRTLLKTIITCGDL